MTEERIPLATIDSGEKYVNERGMRVIKDGIKASSTETAPLQKPDWLRMRIQSSPKFDAVRSIVHEHRLATVCEEALERRHRDDHVDGRRVHPCLPFLFGEYRQSQWLARWRRAG